MFKIQRVTSKNVEYNENMVNTVNMLTLIVLII